MQTAGPVDSDVALPTVQTRRALHGAAGADAAKLEQSIEDWTIIPDIVLALFLGEVVHVVGSDLVEEVDVLVRVELRHFEAGRRFRALQMSVRTIGQCSRATYVYLHLRVQVVVHDQAVGHPYAVRLHRMASNISVVPDV